jgi:hypothetical protein
MFQRKTLSNSPGKRLFRAGSQASINARSGDERLHQSWPSGYPGQCDSRVLAQGACNNRLQSVQMLASRKARRFIKRNRRRRLLRGEDDAAEISSVPISYPPYLFCPPSNFLWVSRCAASINVGIGNQNRLNSRASSGWFSRSSSKCDCFGSCA